METAECWEISVKRDAGPSLHALTRQGLPALRGDASKNMCERGAYVLKAGEGADEIVLLASGSEVHLAVEAHTELAAQKLVFAKAGARCLTVKTASWV